MNDHLVIQIQERARATSINELGRMHRRRDLADVAIFQGWPLPQFQNALLQEIAPETRAHCAVGLSDSETRQYSLLRILGHLGSRPDARHEGLEMEASRAVAKQIGREPSPGGIFVPLEIQQRDLTATMAGAGGYLVGGKAPPGSFIEALRARSVVRRIGATIIGGLRENAPIPRQSNTSTAQWLTGEATTITASEQSFGEVVLAPKTIGALTILSAQLAQQSPSAEAIVQADLGASVALGMDAAAIYGAGTLGEPLGIINTSGIGTVSGTSLAYAGCLEFQSDVLANAMRNRDTLGYVTTTAIAKLLASRQRFTGSDATLWEGNLADGTIAGLPAMSSEQIPAGHMLFGDWSQLLIGEWGILEVVTDPFTYFATRRIQVRAMYTVDIGLRHEQSFSVATAVT